uniref:F0F1 ATP synthase subunit gamma n=1 Tax=Pararhizobium sp. IMCC3301 TaxID=3067904 RepID=UPI0027410589|nr:F0F1 ATP synthase subunit gamma [Pararhizobium sp. IMCC3301]
MPSLKDLKNRIASVKATQKITKAMQMVAAAKLRRAQNAAESARPYAERMDAVLANISAAMEGRDDAPMLMRGTGDDQTHLLVVCTAERGLCGGFNSSISRLARKRIRELNAAGKTVKILCVGKKGYDALKREFASQIIKVVDLREFKNIGYENAQTIGKMIIAMYEAGEFDICSLFFSRFQSVMSQIPTEQQIIPAKAPEGTQEGTSSASVYEYEPSEEEILGDLLPRNLSVQVFRALLENAASEQGARMSAMDSATRNAGEMIDKLTMTYNRQRQAQITKELIEIISGAEAL